MIYLIYTLFLHILNIMFIFANKNNNQYKFIKKNTKI